MWRLGLWCCLLWTTAGQSYSDDAEKAAGQYLKAASAKREEALNAAGDEGGEDELADSSWSAEAKIYFDNMKAARQWLDQITGFLKAYDRNYENLTNEMDGVTFRQGGEDGSFVDDNRGENHSTLDDILIAKIDEVASRHRSFVNNNMTTLIGTSTGGGIRGQLEGEWNQFMGGGSGVIAQRRAAATELIDGTTGGSMKERFNSVTNGRYNKLNTFLDWSEWQFSNARSTAKADWASRTSDDAARDSMVMTLWGALQKNWRAFKTSVAESRGSLAKEKSETMAEVNGMEKKFSRDMRDDVRKVRQQLMEKEGMQGKYVSRYIKQGERELSALRSDFKRESLAAKRTARKAAVKEQKKVAQELKAVEQYMTQTEGIGDMRNELKESAAAAITEANDNADKMGRDTENKYRDLRAELKQRLHDLRNALKAKMRATSDKIHMVSKETVTELQNAVDERAMSLEEVVDNAKEWIREKEASTDDTMKYVVSGARTLLQEANGLVGRVASEQEQVGIVKDEVSQELQARNESMARKIGDYFRPVDTLMEEAPKDAAKYRAKMNAYAETKKEELGMEGSRTQDLYDEGERMINQQNITLNSAKLLDDQTLEKFKSTLEPIFSHLETFIADSVPNLRNTISSRASTIEHKVGLTMDKIAAKAEELHNRTEEEVNEVVDTADAAVARDVAAATARAEAQRGGFDSGKESVDNLLQEVERKVHSYVRTLTSRHKRAEHSWEDVYQAARDREELSKSQADDIKGQVTKLEGKFKANEGPSRAERLGQEKLNEVVSAFEKVAEGVQAHEGMGQEHIQQLSTVENDGKQAAADAKEDVAKTVGDAHSTLTTFNERLKAFEDDDVRSAAKFSSFAANLREGVLRNQIRQQQLRVDEAKRKKAAKDAINSAAQEALVQVQQENENVKAHIVSEADGFELFTTRQARKRAQEAERAELDATRALADEEAQLQAKQQRLEKHLEDASFAADKARQGADEFGKQSVALSEEASHVVGSAGAEEQKLVAQRNKENDALTDAVGNAELAIQLVESLNKTLGRLSWSVDDQWQRKVSATYERMADAIARNDKTHEVVKAVASLTAQADDANKVATERKHQAGATLRSMEEEGDQYEAQVKGKLENEARDLEIDTNATQRVVEAESSAFINRMEKGLVPNMQKVVDSADALAKKDHSATDEQLDELEKLLAKAATMDMTDVHSLDKEVETLSLKHAELSRFVHTYRIKDAAWKKMVEDKFRDLGVRVNSTALQVLNEANEEIENANKAAIPMGDAVNEQLNGLEAQQSKQLADLFSKQDEQIAALYANEELTEQERQAQIAAIQKATKESASEIFEDQARMREKQEEMEHALDRYSRLVDAAAAETDRAIADGHLAPSAREVEANLAAVGMAIEKLRHRPWVGTSLVERGHEHPHPLRAVNEQLREANAELRQEVSRLRTHAA